MAERELFDQIAALGSAWPELRGEPNLQDVPWLARSLMDFLSVVPPPEFPPANDGVALVELVEERLLRPSRDGWLRRNTPSELVELCALFIEEIRRRTWLSDNDASSFIAALLNWRGGIGMAKTLRDVDSQGTSYTLAHRKAEYQLLETEWSQRGGEWVRYGASLARALEVGRGKERFPDDWVPRDSPYWGLSGPVHCPK